MKKENILYAIVLFCFSSCIVFSSEQNRLCTYEEEQKNVATKWYDTEIEAIEELKSCYQDGLKWVEIETSMIENVEIKAQPTIVILFLDKIPSKVFFIIYSKESKKYTFEYKN